MTRAAAALGAAALSLLAPLAVAQKHAPALGVPEALGAEEVQLAPSAAVRSASFALLDTPPTAPVSVALVCFVKADGAIGDCVDAATPLPAALDARGFMALARLDAKDRLEHALLGIARLRARVMVLRPTGRARLVRLAQVVAPADRVALPDAPTVASAALRVIGRAADAHLLYPAAALRQGARARVTVLCRVQADGALFCRDGVAAGEQRPGDAEDFVFATYQLFSTMRVAPNGVAGSDVRLATNWALP